MTSKISLGGHTLHEWVKQADRDSGRTPGLTTDLAAKLKALERENWELRQANEILRKASAYFAPIVSWGRSAMRTSPPRLNGCLRKIAVFMVCGRFGGNGSVRDMRLPAGSR